MEIWKDIPGYEGLYQASNQGKIKSLDRDVDFPNSKRGAHVRHYKERVLKQSFTSTGYYMVVLSKDGIETSYKAHQIIAKSFIPNPNGYKQINHKDENPLNNNVDNLEWCDAKYNCNYGNHNKNLRESQISSRGVIIHKYDLLGNHVKTYRCGKDVEKDGFKRRGVYSCCNKKIRKYKNHVFRFEGDDFSLSEARSKIRVFKYDKNENIVHVYNSIREAQRIEKLGAKLFSAKNRQQFTVIFNEYKYQIEQKS